MRLKSWIAKSILLFIAKNTSNLANIYMLNPSKDAYSIDPLSCTDIHAVGKRSCQRCILFKIDTDMGVISIPN